MDLRPSYKLFFVEQNVVTALPAALHCHLVAQGRRRGRGNDGTIAVGVHNLRAFTVPRTRHCGCAGGGVPCL